MLLSVADFEKTAKKVLPTGLFGYVSGGAEDQSTLEANRSIFRTWFFTPHCLENVSVRNQEVQLFDAKWSAPIGISPIGASSLISFDGDIKLASAAEKLNIPFILSAASTTPLEKVLSVNENTWYQAYLPADTSVILPLLQRLKNSGVKVLIITVDTPIASIRENEIRNGFSLPLKFSFKMACTGLARPRWLISTFAKTMIYRGVPHFENLTAVRGKPIIAKQSFNHREGRCSFSWDEISLIRDLWEGQLLIKGILRVEDALTAKKIGVDGVYISNHGGRQLDGAIPSLLALPKIRAALKDLPIIFDGGIRRGTDILKAYALGANFVFSGRPFAYGLAVKGEDGVKKISNIFREEIDTNLALLGCTDINKIDKTFITKNI